MVTVNKPRPLVKFKMDGAAEMMKCLDQLSTAMGNTVLRKSAITAMQPVADAASQMANVGPVQRKRNGKSGGYFKKSFIVSTQLSKSQKSIAKDDGYSESSKSVNVYAGSTDRKSSLEEWGTGERVQKSTGRSTGAARPFPVLRPAWDANKEKVYNIFSKLIWSELDKAAQRLGKKAIKGTLTAKEKQRLLS